MEEKASTTGVTPYELATLATRICPELCATDPQRALHHAVDLLNKAEYELWQAKEAEKYSEEAEKTLDEIREDWVRGLKQITGERRRERATKRFAKFIAHTRPGKLNHYKRNGFTLNEIHDLVQDFTNWKRQPKRKKGKQGHRTSDSDGRLRTQLVGLVPTKPRKPA
jgi:hypothetical protein